MPKLSSYTFESWHVLAGLFLILCGLIFFINDTQNTVDAKQDLSIITIEEDVDYLRENKIDKDQYRIDMKDLKDAQQTMGKDLKEILKELRKP